MKQIEYFDKSKVRDKEGRLRPVYHYTNEAFTAFRPMDASKGSRRTHGDGYYVSTNATEFADFGKNKMVMYANIMHDDVVELIQEHRREHGEPPKLMMELYDYLHERHIEDATAVKVMQNTFKGV